MDDKLRALLEQIESRGELRDFDGTKYEKSALITTASRRGLIVWVRKRGKYELSATGRRRLAAARAGRWTWPFSVGSARVISTSVAAGLFGAMVFYAGAFHQMFRGPTAASATVSPNVVTDASPGPEPVVATAASVPPRQIVPDTTVAQPTVRAAVAAVPATPVAPKTEPASVQAAPVAASVPAPAPPMQTARVEEPANPAPPAVAAAPTIPPVVVPDDALPPAAAAAPPAEPPKAGKRRHKVRHVNRHRKRNDFGVALASLNIFTQRLFAPPPRHSRRR